MPPAIGDDTFPRDLTITTTSTLTSDSPRFPVLLAAALLTCHLLLALALIPPWQQPDEPTHVAGVETQVSQLLHGNGIADPGREAAILESMARYDWWEHRRVGFKAPAVLARTFQSMAEMGFGPVGSPVSLDQLSPYAIVAGRVLTWLPRASVTDDLYWLRGASAILGLLTLWAAWLAARECFDSLGAVVVPLLLALHPQFAVVSTAASPDAFVNLAGAVVWWQAASAVRRGRILPLGGMWAAAMLATAVDRMGVPLLVFGLIVSAFFGLFRTRAWKRPSTVVVVLAAASGLAASAWAFSMLPETLTIPSEPISWSSFIRSSWLMFQSWWFAPGWGRYTTPGWWIAAVAALSALSIVGAARLSFRRIEDGAMRPLVLLAAFGVVVQLAAVYVGIHLRLGVGAQGRYLMPLLVPSLVILWGGLEAWVPSPRRPYAAVTVLLLFAVLDAAAWMLVMIPAYYDSL